MRVLEERQESVRIPLTEAQKELALNCLIGAENSLGYHLSVGLELFGDIDVQALLGAVQQVVDSHEALRIIELDANSMCQIVANSLMVTIPVVDLMEDQNLEESILRYRAEEAGRAFDFTKGPFIRFRLLRQSSSRVILMVTVHHIVLDGLGLGIVLSELAKIYSAKVSGGDLRLSEPSSWIDYARLAAQTSSVDIAGDSLWKSLEDHQFVPLTLTSDIGRHAKNETTASRVDVKMTGEQLQTLRSVASDSGVTLYTLLLATYSQFICRWCGVEQGLIGMQASARPSDFGDLVGHDTNLLPFPVRKMTDQSLSTYLREVQGLVYDLYDRRSVSFGAIAREFPALRGGSQRGLTCLFNVDPVAEVPFFEGLSCVQSPENHGSTNFDLDLNIVISQRDALWSLTFSTGSLNEERAGQLLRYLVDYTLRVASVCSEPLGTIPLAPVEDRKLLWEQCVRGPVLDGQFTAPYDSFARYASKYSDAIAVSSSKEELTFKALEELVSRYACGLRRREVREGSIIALCLYRSIDAVALALASLRLGAIFVPIDAELPLGRRESILLDAEPLLVVIGEGVSPTDCSQKEVSIQELRDSPCGDAIGCVSPQSSAYIIYTSGTTGRPKGVVVAQGSLSNVLQSYRDMYTLRPLTTHLQSASFSFDVFIGDILRSVCLGGRLFICPSEARLDPRELSRVVLEKQIEFAEFVPAVFRNLCKHAEDNKIMFPALRTAVISSDSWAAPEYRRFRRSFPNTRILNAFGITEVTIDSTCYDDSMFCLPEEGMVPIGKPFYNTSLMILDEALCPLPVGVPGELYIGGAGVAVGYHRNPELTADRFIDVSSDGGTERFYRTGDLGRVLANGQIQLLGRADYQVKVRGVRIELEEVDEVIRSIPEIDDALTVIENGQRLIAYVVTRSEDLTVGRLRQTLSSKLSPASIPSEFRVVARIPLNSNGKRDRILVKSQESHVLSSGIQAEAPLGELERRMLEVWRQVLSSQELTTDDHFFDAGGHSLTAVELCRAIERDFGVRVPVMRILECGNVRRLCEQFTLASEVGHSSCLKRGTLHNHALVFIHGLLLYSEVLRHVEGPSSYAIWQDRINDTKPTDLSVERVVEAYLPALLSIPEPELTICGFSDSGFLAFELTRALHRLGRSARVVLLDSWLPGTAPEAADASAEWAKFEASSLEAHTHLFRAMVGETELVVENSDRGWTQYAEGGLTYHDFDCDHYALLNGENAVQVGKELSMLF